MRPRVARRLAPLGILLLAGCGQAPPPRAGHSPSAAAKPASPPAPTTARPLAIPDMWVATTGEASRPSAAAPDSLPLRAAPDSGDFAAAAAAQIARLDPALTPARWLRANVDDSVELADGHTPRSFDPSDLDGDWCVLARRRFRLPDGRTVVRAAFFYPPPMPAQPVLPSVASADSAPLEECVLGAIRIEIEQPAPHGADTIDVRRLRDALAVALGQADTVRPTLWPLAHYAEITVWTRPDRWIAAGFRGSYGQPRGAEFGIWAATSAVRPSAAPETSEPRPPGQPPARIAQETGLEPGPPAAARHALRLRLRLTPGHTALRAGTYNRRPCGVRATGTRAARRPAAAMAIAQRWTPSQPRSGSTSGLCRAPETNEATPSATAWPRSTKWAWDELNVRPHAYQACALTT